MKIYTAVFTALVCGVGCILAEEPTLQQSPQFAELSWESWVADISVNLKEREEKWNETLVHGYFWVGGKTHQIRWIPPQSVEKKHPIIAMDIFNVLNVAKVFLNEKLPDPIAQDCVISGCQKFYFKKAGVYVWFVDVKIHPQFYIRTGPPIRKIVSIPIDEYGNLLCELVEVKASPVPGRSLGK